MTRHRGPAGAIRSGAQVLVATVRELWAVLLASLTTPEGSKQHTNFIHTGTVCEVGRDQGDSLIIRFDDSIFDSFIHLFPVGAPIGIGAFVPTTREVQSVNAIKRAKYSWKSPTG